MLRVLHVIGKMGVGGAETMLMNLYRNIDRTKVQFDFVVHTSERQFYDDEILMLGGKIFRTQRYNVTNYSSYKRYWDRFFDKHPEYRIVHGHINSSAAVYLSCAKKHGRVAVVHSHNTKSPEKNMRAYASRLVAYPLRYIADYYFACSRQAGIDRFGKRVVSSKRFWVLNNAINADKYGFNGRIRDEMRKKNHIDSDCVIFGHVGRFLPQKNHKFLVEIFKQISKELPYVKLWLIGEGELQSEVAAWVEKEGLEDKVQFWGVTSHVQDYLQAMDVFLFPSLYEGLGMALVEAQAAGLPCVVSEAIQKEADIGAGLLHQISLDEKPTYWAKTAIDLCMEERKDTRKYVVNAGFDVLSTARRMQAFYLATEES